MASECQFFLEDGSFIRYKVFGSGKPLILLHTIRNRLEYFDRVIPLLESSFTIYALDLPGFGGSPVNKAVNYDEPFITQALAEFIEKNKLSQLTLAGESIGGVLCATVATTLPEKVDQIFMFNPYDYDTVFGEGVRRANLFARFIIWSMSLPIIGNGVAALENRLILWLMFRGGVCNKRAITFKYLSLLGSSIRKPGNIYHMKNVFLNFKSWTAAKTRYSQIKTPTTLVYGQFDWSSSKERSESRALISPKRFVELENTGHFSFLDAPESVAEIIKS